MRLRPAHAHLMAAFSMLLLGSSLGLDGTSIWAGRIGLSRLALYALAAGTVVFAATLAFSPWRGGRQGVALGLAALAFFSASFLLRGGEPLEPGLPYAIVAVLNGIGNVLAGAQVVRALGESGSGPMETPAWAQAR